MNFKYTYEEVVKELPQYDEDIERYFIYLQRGKK